MKNWNGNCNFIDTDNAASGATNDAVAFAATSDASDKQVVANAQAAAEAAVLVSFFFIEN